MEFNSGFKGLISVRLLIRNTQEDSIIQDIFNLTKLIIKYDNFIGHPFNTTITCGCEAHYAVNNTACSRLICIILSQLL